jgi:UDP-N-acetylmuramate--alanine ligase
VFVDDIAAMPQAVVDNLRDGDVLLCMGAGSIGAVPAKIIDVLAATVPTTQVGKGA